MIYHSVLSCTGAACKEIPLQLFQKAVTSRPHSKHPQIVCLTWGVGGGGGGDNNCHTVVPYSAGNQRSVGESPIPVIQAYREHVDDDVRVRHYGEVHPDGVVHPPVLRLVQRYHGPRSLVQMVQRVRDGVVLLGKTNTHAQRVLMIKTNTLHRVQHEAF